MNWLLRDAEAALSPRRADEESADLFSIAPNPFEEGRKHQRAAWESGWRVRASKLIWC